MKTSILPVNTILGALLAMTLAVHHTMAFQGPALLSPGARASDSTRRLGYRDNASVETTTDKQAVVDDYLEFLERRYNRLNEGEQEQTATFSAWKWLMHGSGEDSTTTTTEQPHENAADSALHVLGLADLASQRLLQKYSKATTVDENVIDVTPAAVSGMNAVVQPIANQRKRLLSFQAAKVRAVTRVLWNNIVKVGPTKAVRKIVSLGGGEKTIGVTLTVMSAVLFMVAKPLAQTIVAEGAHHA